MGNRYFANREVEIYVYNHKKRKVITTKQLYVGKEESSVNSYKTGCTGLQYDLNQLLVKPKILNMTMLTK